MAVENRITKLKTSSSIHYTRKHTPSMNTLIMPLFLAFIVSSAKFTILTSPPGRRDCPTKLARYQTAVYPTADGKNLRINIDKQLGGRVAIQLRDADGTLYFDETLSPTETKARYRLDLSGLADGNYVLSVSNGLDIVRRDVRLTTSQPTIAPRLITLL